MRTVINTYNPEGVDEAVLQGTGSGGLLSKGFLADGPLASYVGSAETVVFVRSNAKRGVSSTHLEEDDDRTFRPGDGYRAFAAITDTRILFVVGDSGDGDERDRTVSVPLADIELVEGSEGVLASELVVTTRSDEVWRFPCKGDLGAVVEYLDVASMAWMGVESHLETAKKRLVDVSQRCEAGEFDGTMRAITAARAEVRAATREEGEFAPGGIGAMDSRLERTAERIRDAELAALRARGTHLLDRAERRWREDEYREAYDDFLAAHADFAAALGIEDTDLESTTDLREKLARVRRNLDALERAPLDRARKATDRAYEVDDPRESVTHLERALERYRTALELDWGVDDPRFTGDTETIRERVDAIASELVETRRRLAAQHVRAGITARENGQTESAAREYRQARDLLESALDTARELVPDAVETVREHRDAVDRRLGDLDDGGVSRVYSD